MKGPISIAEPVKYLNNQFGGKLIFYQGLVPVALGGQTAIAKRQKLGKDI